MIPAILYFLFYAACGMITIRLLLPRHSVLSRVWLGLSLGVLEEMWFPALCAFFWRFGLLAHGLALIPAAGTVLIATLFRDRHPVRGWDETETDLLRQMLFVVIPLTLLGGFLQYTHVMRVDAFGNWNVGQSTYGDLPMHLSFITGLKNASFPADYPFYPGNRLSYPFLTDSLSTSFYLLGCSLQASVVIPGTLMMMLCFMGVMILGREMTAGKKTIVLATLLFFLNGGLGFLYDFDLAGGTDADGIPEVWNRIQSILSGYYKTPTNQPAPNNLRWSNVIADLMIPQRTLLGGWCCVLPCFYLLEKNFGHEEQKTCLRETIMLGIWAGALPLIHTHSFLALGLYTAGVMMDDLIHGGKKKELIGRYALYGGITVLLAFPQLFGFTFAQAFQEGSSHSFLTFRFNWVNSTGGETGNLMGDLLQGISGMKDLYLWFYIKNIGLPVIFLILALLEKKRKHRRMFSGALVIILAVEFIRFQPNEYDNNKLLYLAWMICCMIVADWMAEVWRRLRGLRGRNVLGVMTAIVLFLSAGLTLWRECVSDYQAYSREAVEAGVFAREETAEDAVFLTGTQHLNPVLSIAGKTIVCGPDLWLYWHGFDTTARKSDIQRFFEDPAGNRDVLDLYGVEYIYVSSYERSSYDVNEAALAELYETVFSNREATIYRVWPG